MALFHLLFYVEDLFGVVVVKDMNHVLLVQKWHLIVKFRNHLIMFNFAVTVSDSLLEKSSSLIENLHFLVT